MSNFLIEHQISFHMVAILGFAYLCLKHFILDFPAQTPYQWRNKHIYGHPGGLLHSALHVLGSFLFYLVLIGLSPIQQYPSLVAWALIGSAVFEFLIHYHCDWWKMNHCQKNKLDPKTTAMFWTVTGFDQWVHYMTYICLIWFWVDYVLFWASFQNVTDLMIFQLEELQKSLENLYPNQ